MHRPVHQRPAAQTRMVLSYLAERLTPASGAEIAGATGLPLLQVAGALGWAVRVGLVAGHRLQGGRRFSITPAGSTWLVQQ